MKILAKLTLTLSILIFASAAYAEENDNVYISGTYTGHSEHQVIRNAGDKIITDEAGKTYDVVFTFNHDKFVYQERNFACTGTYIARDGKLDLNIESVRGSIDQDSDFLNKDLQYSFKDGKMMIWSSSESQGENARNGIQDIIMFKLNRQ